MIIFLITVVTENGNFFNGILLSKIICPILAFRSTYLHVSMWKHVLRNEQSPRLSSVCFWIIFLKCNFLHGSDAFTLVHSTLVPCGQNSITCAPVTGTNISNNVCGGLLHYDAVWTCVWFPSISSHSTTTQKTAMDIFTVMRFHFVNLAKVGITQENLISLTTTQTPNINSSGQFWSWKIQMDRRNLLIYINCIFFV